MLEVVIQLDKHKHTNPAGFTSVRKKGEGDRVQYVFASGSSEGAYAEKESDSLRMVVTDVETGEEIEFADLEFEEIDIDGGEKVIKYRTKPGEPVEMIEARLCNTPSYTPADIQ